MQDDMFVARRNLAFAHHSLTSDEMQTVDTILRSEPNADILVTPNHHFNEDGVFCGFRVCFPAHTSGVQLPINRRIFFGTTIVEASSSLGVNNDIIDLVADQETCRAKMQALMKRIDERSHGNEPSLDCMPLNVDPHSVGGAMNGTGDRPNKAAVRGNRVVDCRPWAPEVPDFLGIYHTYARGWNKDSREHRIYLACSGGCSLAAEAYYNLLLDLGSDVDLDEIVDSEETWWLRQASYRARCRLLLELANEFGLNIATISDVHAYEPVAMARATTDTMTNDVNRLRSGHVAVFNECIDTTTAKNGVINIMHPTEGLWIFKGPTRSTFGMTTLGSGWGDQRRCGVFPSGVFKLVRSQRHIGGSSRNTAAHDKDNRSTASSSRRSTVTNSGSASSTMNREFSTVMSRAAKTIVCYNAQDSGSDSHSSMSLPLNEYLWYDEEFMETLEDMGYDRDFGVLELMPVVVGATQW